MRIDYTTSQAWDVIWNRPYVNYEKHHQLFWQLIRDNSKGLICDLACGSASCWRDRDFKIVGVDFSYAACEQASKNCPNSVFIVADATDTQLADHAFDTVVVSGLVNYYRDLSPLKKEIQRLVMYNGKVLITINVIEDFPDRTWTDELIQKEFGSLGIVRSTFYEKVGFFIAIEID